MNKEAIKTKAKELANKAYWQTQRNAVSIYEISDPIVELILQEMAEWAISEKEKRIEYLKAEINRLNNVIANKDWEIEELKK